MFDERGINEPTTDDNIQMTSCKSLYTCKIHKLVARYSSVPFWRNFYQWNLSGFLCLHLVSLF